MKLTVFTDYSLRVLMYLASRPEQRATIAEIGAAYGISTNHLTKVVHHLGTHGWVRTVRGRGGGLVLSRPAKEIRIGMVVRDTEGVAQPAHCFAADADPCAIASRCRLKGVLAEATKAFHAVLDRYTLEDVTRNRDELAAVLTFHRQAAAGAS
jgi:Rrf2 family nitric oxide-sensitive transcriptional repressor